MKTVAIVARSYAEANDYALVMEEMEPGFKAKSVNIVSERDIRGYRDLECHLIGRYTDNPAWNIICEDIRHRGFKCKEVFDWR